MRAAHDHVFDFGRIDTGALQGVLHGVAAELRAVAAMLDVRAAAVPPPDESVVVRQVKRRASGWVWVALAAGALAAVWYLVQT